MLAGVRKGTCPYLLRSYQSGRWIPTRIHLIRTPMSLGAGRRKAQSPTSIRAIHQAHAQSIERRVIGDQDSASTPRPVDTDVVLVGGGHSHVEVMRRFAMSPLPGVRITLVSRDLLTPYSGMLPGLVAGHYRYEEAHIDLRNLASFAGARLYHGRVRGLDLERRLVQVEGRPPVAFDLLSLDIGSLPSRGQIDGAAQWAIPVKPVDVFLERLAALEERIRRERSPLRLLIIGAGAGGVELALALDRRLGEAARYERPRITIVCADAEVLPGHGAATRRRLRAALSRAGIELRSDHRVSALSEGEARFAGVPSIGFDAAVLVTHASAPPWLTDTGLELDAEGFVRVRETLQSTSHPNVFAAGDVAAFTPRPLAKSGVYAVRAGPVLAENLRRTAKGENPGPFRAQRRTLSLISTGRPHAVASWGGIAFQGKWVWRLKDWIDRRWMRRYQDLPSMTSPASEIPGEAAPDAMRCGGCAAKVASPILSAALARIDPGKRRDVIVGLRTPDDAAILEIPPGTLLVQSVDHFRPFVDDPYVFGQVTAVHCLSDLFAMGAKAHSAQAMVTLAYGRADKQEEELFQVLSGATEALREAGAALVGGHTGEGPEASFGLAVNGFVAPDAALRKGGARPGDRLVLTKALGTGVILAADMRARAGAGTLRGALASMRLSNRMGVEVLAAHGASGCTDISGFGLLGHLVEVLEASGMRARIETELLPLLPGTEELFEQGFRSTLHPGNEAFKAHLGPHRTSPDGPPILYDPQTSGGLLASVPGRRAGACILALRAAGYEDAAMIGEVLPGGGGPLVDLAWTPPANVSDRAPLETEVARREQSWKSAARRPAKP